MKRIAIIWLLFVAPALADGTLGVVTERPAGGRFVKADGVYLVPHEVTIPGTGVTFAMEPVAGAEAPGGGGFGPCWIGRCEVTWGEYREYMQLCNVFDRFNELGVRPVVEANRLDAVTAPSKLYDPSFTYAAGDAAGLPAVSMSAYAAKQYTKWLSLLTEDFYRLPSESEWEHACRAGSKAAYSFGDDPTELDAYAWHAGNSGWQTRAVGGKKPNAWGLFDMHGNAREWVLDAPGAEPIDPDGAGGEPPVVWPTKVYPRMLCGGSALLAPDELTSASRAEATDELTNLDPNIPHSPWWLASDAAQDIGFRVLRPWRAPPRAGRSKYWDAEAPRVEKIADFRIDQEGRGERGLVDPDLPKAIEALPAR